MADLTVVPPKEYWAAVDTTKFYEWEKTESLVGRNWERLYGSNKALLQSALTLVSLSFHLPPLNAFLFLCNPQDPYIHNDDEIPTSFDDWFSEIPRIKKYIPPSEVQQKSRQKKVGDL